mmetsp:Transcript_28372/g.42972  ORF Transcript_28372/g.42972 Transcript_28372/m.42972 type:complete len:140 (+) Transcript_28372:1427-1846(+)
MGLLQMIKGSEVHDPNGAEEQLRECQVRMQRSNASLAPFRLVVDGLSKHSPVRKIDIKINKKTPPRVRNRSPDTSSQERKHQSRIGKEKREFAKRIRISAKRVMLDTIIYQALLNFEWQEWQVVKDYFGQAYELAEAIG